MKRARAGARRRWLRRRARAHADAKVDWARGLVTAMASASPIATRRARRSRAARRGAAPTTRRSARSRRRCAAIPLAAGGTLGDARQGGSGDQGAGRRRGRSRADASTPIPRPTARGTSRSACRSRRCARRSTGRARSPATTPAPPVVIVEGDGDARARLPDRRPAADRCGDLDRRAWAARSRRTAKATAAHGVLDARDSRVGGAVDAVRDRNARARSGHSLVVSGRDMRSLVLRCSSWCWASPRARTPRIVVTYEAEGEADAGGADPRVAALDDAFARAVAARGRRPGRRAGAAPRKKQDLDREIVGHARLWVAKFTVTKDETADDRRQLTVSVRVDRDKMRARLAELEISRRGRRPRPARPNARADVAILLRVAEPETVRATYGAERRQGRRPGCAALARRAAGGRLRGQARAGLGRRPRSGAASCRSTTTRPRRSRRRRRPSSRCVAGVTVGSGGAGARRRDAGRAGHRARHG